MFSAEILLTDACFLKLQYGTLTTIAIATKSSTVIALIFAATPSIL